MKAIYSVRMGKAITKMRPARLYDHSGFSEAMPYIKLLGAAESGMKRECLSAPSSEDLSESVPLLGDARGYPEYWIN